MEKGFIAEKSERYSFLLSAAYVVLGAFLIALSAQVKISLWWTPVPLSLQTACVMLVGAVSGSKRGSWSAVLYLSLLAMGFPVQAGGVANIYALAGPTAGYLWGFIPLAYLAGRVYSSGFSSKIKSLLLLAASFVQIMMGALWLGFILGDFSLCWFSGVAPFLIGDFIKVLLVDTIARLSLKK